MTPARTLQVIGLLILVVAGVRKMATDGGLWTFPLVLVGILVATALPVWWWTHRNDTARRRVVAARPGWDTHAVWADRALRHSLVAAGRDPGRLRAGARLTLAWSPTEVQLWRGDEVLVELPWDQVWTITRTIGDAASTGNPAVELVTHDGTSFVVVPTGRPDGGMLPASATQVDELNATLRATRDAAAERRTAT